eukprot:768758-Hanusia_phi.AAC.5
MQRYRTSRTGRQGRRRLTPTACPRGSHAVMNWTCSKLVAHEKPGCNGNVGGPFLFCVRFYCSTKESEEIWHGSLGFRGIVPVVSCSCACLLNACCQVLVNPPKAADKVGVAGEEGKRERVCFDLSCLRCACSSQDVYVLRCACLLHGLSFTAHCDDKKRQGASSVENAPLQFLEVLWPSLQGHGNRKNDLRSDYLTRNI